MQRVAKRAGVSIMTVSRYFNHPDTLAMETRERVAQAIHELRYVPNAAARSLIFGRTDTIALVVSDITNPFFTTITRGVEDVLQNHGFTLIIGNSDETLEKERRYLDNFLSRRIDGLILVPAPNNGGHLSLLRHHQVPVVLVDRVLEDEAVDTVRGDSREGGRILTRHLVELGHRSIAFIGGDPGTSSLKDRVQGYQEALDAEGLLHHIHVGRYDRDSGREIVNALLVEGAGGTFPTALVAANSQVAAGVLEALRSAGVAVPADVSVACFDDFELEALNDPFLTVVRQPAREIGKVAAGRLLSRLKGEDHPYTHDVLDVTLVPRASTAPPATEGGRRENTMKLRPN